MTESTNRPSRENVKLPTNLVVDRSCGRRGAFPQVLKWAVPNSRRQVLAGGLRLLCLLRGALVTCVKELLKFSRAYPVGGCGAERGTRSGPRSVGRLGRALGMTCEGAQMIECRNTTRPE